MHLRSFGPLVALAVVCCTGCCTPKSAPATSRAPAPQTGAKPKQEQVDRFRTAVSTVVRDHGFIETLIVVVGADATTWLITARTRSPGELMVATVKITPEEQVTVDLPAYQRLGADWALLGRFFRGPIDQEASAMKKEMQEQLDRAATSAVPPR